MSAVLAVNSFSESSSKIISKKIVAFIQSFVYIMQINVPKTFKLATKNVFFYWLKKENLL